MRLPKRIVADGPRKMDSTGDHAMLPIRTLMLTALMLAPLAQAQDYDDRSAPHRDDNVRYAYAQVLRADPIYERVLYTEPQEQCDDDSEYERIGSNRSSSGSTGGTILGAVVGGVLGNQIGKGDGRKAATVGGAVLGGVIGNRAGAGNNDNRYGGEYVRPGCRTVAVEREENHLIGYDVEYRYKGDVYMSRLDRDPGSQVRVRVAVSPVEE